MWGCKDLRIRRGYKEWTPHAARGGRKRRVPEAVGVTWGESRREGRGLPGKGGNKGGYKKRDTPLRNIVYET